MLRVTKNATAQFERLAACLKVRESIGVHRILRFRPRPALQVAPFLSKSAE